MNELQQCSNKTAPTDYFNKNISYTVQQKHQPGHLSAVSLQTDQMMELERCVPSYIDEFTLDNLSEPSLVRNEPLNCASSDCLIVEISSELPKTATFELNLKIKNRRSDLPTESIRVALITITVSLGNQEVPDDPMVARAYQILKHSSSDTSPPNFITLPPFAFQGVQASEYILTSSSTSV